MSSINSLALIAPLKEDNSNYADVLKEALNNLYEDYDTWGDPHEEIPMYEQLVKETEEKINNL